MTVAYDYPNRVSTLGPQGPMALEDRFEVIKEIGDGSFGSVHLARVRTAGAAVAKRGTMVAIKTMKKTFESFSSCLELREVIFLRSLPNHVHLVPALDIFMDPTTKKLHICMENMDGNLYQLMKSRDHRCLDGASVKSILYQIISGLDHIHTNNFFHRDIKPENILITTSASGDSGLNFRRYSGLSTPPSTPPSYTVKIADFGLARETRSKLPYTTYVSTRWYRAPEVLLRAGEYSAPVDMWALGAMAVEVATLKPLFPGGNEVDQVWRVCEIMGSPGNWYNKQGAKVGGGEWREGTQLARKLGFAFPKMAPHTMDTILQPPQWPLAFSSFVTWCLMWDPKNRPTSFQALQHEYFTDAVDPLTRPKSSSKLLGRKQSGYDTKIKEDGPQLSNRSSWFRKSLIGRDSAPPVVAPHQQNTQLASPGPSPINNQNGSPKPRPNATKRATWTNGPSTLAPMPILPSIRPVSPLSNAVTAQAQNAQHEKGTASNQSSDKAPKKIGRQLSLASHGNHYADIASERERGNGLMSPAGGQKESFFSHLRKRARRLSGRNQLGSSKHEDIEASAGRGPVASNRSSMVVDPPTVPEHEQVSDLDRALQGVQYGHGHGHEAARMEPHHQPQPSANPTAYSGPLKRHSSLPRVQGNHSTEEPPIGPISSRTRRALHLSSHPTNRYETPDEEEELLDEALHGAERAARRLGRNPAEDHRGVLVNKDTNRHSLQHSVSVGAIGNPYPTPSPSAKRNGVLFNNLMEEPATPININRRRTKENTSTMWPTPPYEENDWANGAKSNTFAAGSAY